MGNKAIAVALSPAALSLPVLLLQAPLALALAFSTRMSKFQENPIMMFGLSWLYLGGAALCFSIGKWCLENWHSLVKFRGLFTVGIWFIAGLQSVMLSQLAHALTGGEQLSLKLRLAYVPLIWIASIYSATTVLQSRHDYRNQLRVLQGATDSLKDAESSAQQALQSERLKLIDTVRNQIAPELTLISAEVTAMKSALDTDQYSAILEQVDDYSLGTLRKQIAELNSEIGTNSTETHSSDVPDPHQFQIRNLTIDSSRSLRIALAITLGLMLPILDPRQLVVALLQIVATFIPIVLLDLVRTKSRLTRNVPPGSWVIAALVFTLALWFKLDATRLSLRVTTTSPQIPIVGYMIVLLSVILGSVGKHFKDSLTYASQRQTAINGQLKAEVRRTELARQVVRRDLARILHGPIQGRLAAVRMKLHIFTEQSIHGSLEVDQRDVNQLTELIAQIAHEIETFGEEQDVTNQIHLSESLEALAYKWQGMIDVVLDVSHDAAYAVVNDQFMTKKLVAACSEAVTNATRHGNATRVRLSLNLIASESTLQLLAADNGRGVLFHVVPGIGLRDIEADGGRWSFEPSEIGTRFCVEFSLAHSATAQLGSYPFSPENSKLF